MAIANKNDLTHIVRTTQQWTSSYDSYECIPEGVLCVEFTPDGHVKAKIGNGHDIFSKLPYIGGADLTNYFTKNETVKCIEDIIKAKRFICIKGILQNKDQLPSHAECGDLYFVISQNQSSSNKYDEYVYSPSNTWENLGSIPIDIDLSEYAKIVYVDEKIDEVNERIDDIEQHGTHTHANKDILDLITAAFTADEKDKLSTLYNYDDTELRELITQASHTHSNKDILDAISAAFTAEDRVKLDSLTPYDDTILKEKITALERLAHEHSNKRILDRTTASFTTEYERKMRWIRIYTGCTGMEEGIAGLVPAAQAGEEDYVLSGSGEWVPQTGGGGTYELPIASASVLGGIKVGDGLEIDENGVLSATGSSGDSITEGDGITITTDPQTGVKTISVNTGRALSVNGSGELNVDIATANSLGVVKAGSGLNIDEFGNLSTQVAPFRVGRALSLDDESVRLPSAYYKAKYVQSDGAAYCVTEFYPSNYPNAKYVGTASVIGDTDGYKYIFGTQGDNYHSYWSMILSTSSDNQSIITGLTYNNNNDKVNNPITTAFAKGDMINFEASITSGLKLNNELVQSLSTTFTKSTYDMFIFGERAGYVAKARIYSFKIYNSDDTLLANFVPAVRKSDNEVGFYETVSNQFINSNYYGPPFTTDMDDLDVDEPDWVLNADIATANSLGVIKPGTGLTVSPDGTLNATPYTLPTASASTLGGVKVGDGLSIAADGTLSATGGGNYSAGEAINIRNVSGNLPPGYVEVDYIEGNGNCYTVIDYIPNRKTKIVGSAALISTTNDPVLFGARTGSNGNQFVLWFNRYDSTQAKVGFVYGTNTWSTSTDCNDGRLIPYVVGEQFTFLLSLDDEFNINDTFVHNITENGAPADYLKLGIFALVDDSLGNIESDNQIFAGRMYEFKIYEDDVLVVELIPAVNSTTGSVGFYDTVNDKFYTSNRSTQFTYDPSTVHVSGKIIDVKYGDGLTVNQDNELEVSVGDGLQINQDGEVEIDPSIIPDSYDAGNGIEITEVTHEDEFRVQNQEYFFTDHGLTCIITGNYGPRTYTKINDGDIVAAVIGKTGGWYLPLFVGLTEDSVKYSNSYDSNILGPNGSFTYHDKTWYYTADYVLTAGDGVDHAGHLQSMTDTIYDGGAEGDIQAAKDLIDLAVLLPDVSTPTISAKIGNGLSFDANGAIEVNIGDRLHFDSNNALAVNPYYEGEGISIHTLDIPTEYTRVKALSSTDGGNQYIDTGYKINANTVIEMKAVFYKYGSNAWKIPLGTRNSSNYADNGMLFLVTWASDQPGNNPSLWIERVQSVAPSDKKDEFYNDIVNIRIAGTSLTCTNTRTGVTTVLDTETAMPASQYSLFVFATNDHSNPTFYTQMDLHSLTISEADTVIHQYIPCKRNSDNKYGLYDTIDQEFKLSPNNALFTYVAGAPSGDEPLMEEISLLPATTTTLGGVKIGDGILVDSDGTISVDPDIIPEILSYEGGTAISVVDNNNPYITKVRWTISNIRGTSGSWIQMRYFGFYNENQDRLVIQSGLGEWSDDSTVTYYQHRTLSAMINNQYEMTASSWDGTKSFILTFNLPTGTRLNDLKYFRYQTGDDETHRDPVSWEIHAYSEELDAWLLLNTETNATIPTGRDTWTDYFDLEYVSVKTIDAWNNGTDWDNFAYTSGSSDTTSGWNRCVHSPVSSIDTLFPVLSTKIKVIARDQNDGLLSVRIELHTSTGRYYGCYEYSQDEEIIDLKEFCELHSIDVPDYVSIGLCTLVNPNYVNISPSDVSRVDIIWYSDTISPTKDINVNYGNGLTVNQNNELEVNIGTGLEFDQVTGAINVTGGGGGDTIAEGDGISITTDQQTGNKVIAINPGAGLQVNQTTNELEVSSGVVTSIAPTQNTPGSITVTEGDGTTTPVSVISQMGGATSSTAGTAGYVPAPASGDDDAYLRGDGTWDDSVVTEDDELTLVFVPDDYQPS